MGKKNGLAAALAREQENQRLQKKQTKVQQNKGGLKKPTSTENGVNKKRDDVKKNGTSEKKEENTAEDNANDSKEIKHIAEEEKEEDEVHHDEPTEDQGENTNENNTEEGSENKDTPKSRKGSTRAFIPFNKKDKVLLIGEGDCSFSRSILQTGLAKYIKPTNLDSKELLLKKYPDTMEENIKFLEEYVPKDDEEEKASGDEDEGEYDEDEEEEEEDDDVKYDFRKFVVSSESSNYSKSDLSENGKDESTDPSSSTWNSSPLFNVDATQLHKSKLVKEQGPFDAIMFNFPHLGTGIKDQDRNVMAHQKLMISFFQSCLDGETPQIANKNNMNSRNNSRTYNQQDRDQQRSRHRSKKSSLLAEDGAVIVSIFDGLPYSLWDLRRLARENGFSVRRSGSFEWDIFPGYTHRLTGGRGDTTKQASSRNAKIYVFERFDARKTQLRLKHQEAKRQQNKQIKAMATSLKGKKGKRKIARLVKKQKGNN